MKFTLKYASRNDETKVNIKTIGGLRRLQKKLLTKAIKEYNEGLDGFKIRTYKQLRNNTSFSYELIVDFVNMEITFYDYWID